MPTDLRNPIVDFSDDVVLQDGSLTSYVSRPLVASHRRHDERDQARCLHSWTTAHRMLSIPVMPRLPARR